jgi:anti-sigma regulatory factor (Ser/Thr protein kinase)
MIGPAWIAKTWVKNSHNCSRVNRWPYFRKIPPVLRFGFATLLLFSKWSRLRSATGRGFVGTSVPQLGATRPGPRPVRADEVLDSSGLSLAAVFTAVRYARRHVRRRLRQWGLASLADDAELVVSELVTNAVKFTGRPGQEPCWPGGGPAIVRLRLLRFAGRVVIEVWDRDDTVLTAQEAAATAEGGRGLSIVSALCDRWDCRYPGDGSKVVWCELVPPHAGPAR